MENSSELQNPTLTPSETAFSFPPHRRRPLRSRTYHTLIGILSHCHSNSPQVQIQGPVSEENGSLTSVEVNSKAPLVSLPDSKPLEDTLVEETSIGVDTENNGGFDCNQATTPTLDPINSVADGGTEVALKNSISSVDFLVLENQAADCAIQVAKEQDNANNVFGNQTVDLGTLEDLVVDNDFSIADYSDVLDSCFDMDMVTESSKTVNDIEENSTVFEENVLKEAEHELQLKEMELEKLIYSDNVGEEIEEGEISGEADASVDASVDALYEDAASLGESTEMVHGIEDCSNKKEFMCNVEDRGCQQNKMSGPSLINKVNSDCNSIPMKVDSRTTDDERRNFHSQPVFHASHMGTKRSNLIASCSEKQAPSDRYLQVNTAENQMAATYAKDGDVRSKKRKRGARSKGKRAKKRGEKCNFSHDKVPLTKSTPCKHFACNSCMKGDDCPYDHQLSKYPCKKFSADGFCRRGSDCLFSHEILSTTPTASKPESTSAQHTMSAKGGSSSKVSKPNMNFTSPLNNSNSSKHADNHGKNTELFAARTVPRTAGQAPKGISCLSNVNVGCKTTLTAGKSNEMSSEIVAPGKPRGINFLSLARPTPDDSISTMLSKLLSNSKEETRQSVKGSSAALPSKLEEAIRVPILSFGGPSDQSTGGLSPDLSNSFKTPFLSKTPGSLQKAVQTTLAFAANFEHSIKVGSSYIQSRS